MLKSQSGAEISGRNVSWPDLRLFQDLFQDCARLKWQKDWQELDTWSAASSKQNERENGRYNGVRTFAELTHEPTCEPMDNGSYELEL